MNEATLKGKLMVELRRLMPSGVHLRVEDHFTSGIPDISVNYKYRQTWIEVKYANPDFESRDVQEVTMKRLCVCGSAIYVIYCSEKVQGSRLTKIVFPLQFQQWKTTNIYQYNGFAHEDVAEYVKKLHERESR